MMSDSSPPLNHSCSSTIILAIIRILQLPNNYYYSYYTTLDALISLQLKTAVSSNSIV